MAKRRSWTTRLFCFVGLHLVSVSVGMHRWQCYDCGKEWSE